MSKQKLSVITLLAITLLMLSISTIQAQTIQDSAICYGYGVTDLQPKGAGNTIFQYTEKVGYWVQIQNPADVTYRMIWEDPSGNQFRNVAVTLVEKSGENWGIVFDSINVAESTARNKVGVWKVELYIESELQASSEFQIIRYQDILDNIQNIQNQIQDIVQEKDDLLAQNAALEESLQSLQADYQELQAKVGTTSDYQQLQSNYDDLLDDYNTLKDSQSSTRTMMYAAIVVALVAVVIAVYFGAIKK